MTVIRTTQATVHRLHGATFTSYAAPANGSRQLCAWRVEVPPGTVGQPHTVSHEEILLVLEGSATATIDGDAQRLVPGEVALVPAGASFGLDNTSTEPMAAWVTTSVGLEATLADGTTISPPWVR